MLGCVFGIIILLKVTFILLHIQLFKAFLHSILQNFTVLFCIHLSLNLYKLLLVGIDFPTNPAYSTNAYTSFILYLSVRVSFSKKRKKRRVFSSRYGSHGGGKRSRRKMNQVQHVKLIQTKSHDIVYYFYNQILPYISISYILKEDGLLTLHDYPISCKQQPLAASKL